MSQVRQRHGESRHGGVRVERSALGRDAKLLGAAEVAFGRSWTRCRGRSGGPEHDGAGARIDPRPRLRSVRLGDGVSAGSASSSKQPRLAAVVAAEQQLSAVRENGTHLAAAPQRSQRSAAVSSGRVSVVGVIGVSSVPASPADAIVQPRPPWSASPPIAVDRCLHSCRRSGSVSVPKPWEPCHVGLARTSQTVRQYLSLPSKSPLQRLFLVVRHYRKA